MKLMLIMFIKSNFYLKTIYCFHYKHQPGKKWLILLRGEIESLGTAATTGLLYQPQMIGDGECGETDLSQLHFVHHKSHKTRPGFDPGPPRWEASD
jgi:hypothetical protein